MSTKTEEKILARLEKIERLLASFVLTVPSKDSLTEDDVISLVKAGRAEHRAGKTKKLESFGALR